MVDWRDKIDPALKEHLEAQIKESNLYRDAYSKAGNQANAQLWIAIAVLSKQVFNLNQKLKVFEDAIKDIGSNVRQSIGKIEEVQSKVAEVREVSEKKNIPDKIKGVVARKSIKKTIKKKPTKKTLKKNSTVKKKSAKKVRKGISRALKKF